MESVLGFIQAVCAKIQVVSDLLWDFPANFGWYAKIPVIGNFSLAIIMLIGSGIFFTVKQVFIQVRRFRHSISVLMREKAGIYNPLDIQDYCGVDLTKLLLTTAAGDRVGDIITAVRPIAHLTFRFGSEEELERARVRITELVYPVMR